MGVHVEFSVRPPSPPNTYSYVQEENMGSTRKFVNLLIVHVYYQPNSCTSHTEHEWAGRNLSKTAEKVPPAHAQWVYLEEPTGYKAHPGLMSPSICLSVWNTKIHRFFM